MIKQTKRVQGYLRKPTSGFKSVLNLLSILLLGMTLAAIIGFAAPVFLYPDSFVARAANKTMESISNQNPLSFGVIPTKVEAAIAQIKDNQKETPKQKPLENIKTTSNSTDWLGNVTSNIQILTATSGNWGLPDETTVSITPSPSPTPIPTPVPTSEPTPQPPVYSAPQVLETPSVVVPNNQIIKVNNWPFQGGISQGFSRWHPGLDIMGRYGTLIHPVQSGIVVGIFNDWSGLGKHVKVDHQNGLVSVYGHMSEIAVTLGQKVEVGSVLGLVGMTGHTTGPHVHLEIYQNGVAVDPLPRLP